MVMDAQTRHALHLRLDELVGADLAAAMMTAYPPFDWDQVALKSDLQAMEDRLMGALHREMNAQTKTIIFGTVGAMTAMAAGAVGLAQLFG